ncbi:MAG TPA: glutathione S-transferase family protein [Phenylobacterium sp.]|nr:glutathione S-transferase family protein [Phenylobacterium sp.]
MRFYTSVGPNPRVVKMFMLEKGVELEQVTVNLMAGENRQDEHLKRNPAGQMPTLELDDGSYLSEITAICEYLDEKFPGPSLIGETPEERAATRMWTRRIDLNICEPMGSGFRYGPGLPLFQSRIRTIPQAAEDFATLAQERIAWLDGLVGGRDFIAGDKITLADILLYCFLEFGAQVGQPVNPNNKNIVAWLERMRARPSAAGSA